MSTNKTTSILDILNENENNIITEDNEEKYENDYEAFFDFENNIDSRVKAFLKIYDSNKLQAQEIVSDISASYLFCPIETIYFTIKELVKISKLEIPIRLLLCSCVYNVEEKRDLSYELFIYLLNEMKNLKELYNSTLFIDILKYLISIDYKDYSNIKNNIYDLIEFMVNYSSDYIYKNQIYKSMYTLYLENKYYKDCLLHCFKSIKHNCDNKLVIIISSLLYNEDKTDVKSLIEHLCYIAENSSEENIKADVADLLLKFEDEESKNIGRKILNSLEGIKGKRSFYDNSQNVHNIDIDKNTKEFIRFLSTNQSLILHKFNQDNDYEQIVNEILYDEDENKNKITQSLNRIYLDTNIYEGFTLLTLFLKIWIVINTHEYKNELIKRLKEELIDMSDTCSSGHLLRLSNVFSGFGYNISMNIEIEIRSKITHIINNLIKSQNESEEKDEIVDNIGNIEENNKFSLFFMRNIDLIKTELLKDYSDIVNKDEFEEIFRKELVFFETGEI